MSGSSPTSCQTEVAGRCLMPPRFLVTFEGAPAKGGAGLVWTEAHCQGHVGTRAGQVRQLGGKTIDVVELPAPPPEPTLPPIGLDAIAPAVVSGGA